MDDLDNIKKSSELTASQQVYCLFTNPMKILHALIITFRIKLDSFDCQFKRAQVGQVFLAIIKSMSPMDKFENSTNKYESDGRTYSTSELQHRLHSLVKGKKRQ